VVLDEYLGILPPNLTPTTPPNQPGDGDGAGGASINKSIYQDGFQLRKVGMVFGVGRTPVSHFIY
jgi:hypothetical protein